MNEDCFDNNMLRPGTELPGMYLADAFLNPPPNNQMEKISIHHLVSVQPKQVLHQVIDEYGWEVLPMCDSQGLLLIK